MKNIQGIVEEEMKKILSETTIRRRGGKAGDGVDFRKNDEEDAERILKAKAEKKMHDRHAAAAAAHREKMRAIDPNWENPAARTSKVEKPEIGMYYKSENDIQRVVNEIDDVTFAGPSEFLRRAAQPDSPFVGGSIAYRSFYNYGVEQELRSFKKIDKDTGEEKKQFYMFEAPAIKAGDYVIIPELLIKGEFGIGEVLESISIPAEKYGGWEDDNIPVAHVKFSEKFTKNGLPLTVRNIGWAFLIKVGSSRSAYPSSSYQNAEFSWKTGKVKFRPKGQRDEDELNENVKEDESFDWLGLALDTVGLIPGAGEITDGINVIRYLAKKDYLLAALSAISLVPAIGDAVGKGGKVLAYIARYSDDAAKLAATAGPVVIKIAKWVIAHKQKIIQLFEKMKETSKGKVTDGDQKKMAQELFDFANKFANENITKKEPKSSPENQDEQLNEIRRKILAIETLL